MSERVSLGAAGKQLGVGGGDIRRCRVHQGRDRPARRLGTRASGVAPQGTGTRTSVRGQSWGRQGGHRIEVSCCVCGTVRQVRPSLVKGYTHLVCGPCSKVGKRPDVPSRPGMVLVHTFNVAGFFDGYTYRIAAAEERASIARAAALAWAAFLNAPTEPGPDG